MMRKPYPNLTQSGIEWLGDVPAHWRVARMRFHVQMNPTKQEVADNAPDLEVPFLPMEAVGEDGSLNQDQFRRLEDVQNGYTYFAENDVTYAKITPCFENGKGALMAGLEGGFGFGTTELTVLRARSSARPRFVWWLTQSIPFRKLGEASMFGAGGQKRVPDSFAADFSPAWPPLEEQDAISAFLDRETAKIDALIAEQRKLIGRLREKRQAIISRATKLGVNSLVEVQDSGLEWIGGIPTSWRIQELRRIAKPGTSITYGIVQAGPEFEGGVPYIRTSDMNGEELPLDGYPRTSPDIDEAYARSRVEPGDVVVAIRATVGKALLVPAELAGANLTQGTAKVSPGPSILGRFLKYALDSTHAQQHFESLAKGATFREITLDMLRRFPIPVPPIEEQASIVEFLDQKVGALKALITEAETSVALLQEHRSALITAAATGKVDVREAAP